MDSDKHEYFIDILKCNLILCVFGASCLILLSSDKALTYTFLEGHNY